MREPPARSLTKGPDTEEDDMACDICGSGSCTSWMHSAEEQEQYAEAIEAFERAREIRERIRNDDSAA